MEYAFIIQNYKSLDMEQKVTKEIIEGSIFDALVFDYIYSHFPREEGFDFTSAFEQSMGFS